MFDSIIKKWNILNLLYVVICVNMSDINVHYISVHYFWYFKNYEYKHTCLKTETIFQRIIWLWYDMTYDIHKHLLRGIAKMCWHRYLHHKQYFRSMKRRFWFIVLVHILLKSRRCRVCDISPIIYYHFLEFLWAWS